MRGVVDCVVKVSVLDRAQHSGIFGGPIPDALTALCRMLATLHDDNGDVALVGLRRNEWNGTPVSEEEFRTQAGVLPSVRLIGTSSVASRLYTAPAVSVLGIDCPSVIESSNQLVATASARVSLRLSPGEDPLHGRAILIDHLRSVAPWGVQVQVTPGQAGGGYSIDERAPAFGAMGRALAEAWGDEVATTGSGGTIPFVPMLAEAFPGIAVLITGAADKSSYFHSIDESVDLTQVELLAVSEAIFIRDLTSAL